MTKTDPKLDPKPDPKLDLVLERIVDVPPELVFEAWTTPERILKWFAPKPWKTIACELDLRPGGKFNTTMQSPEGQNYPGEGCFLEVSKPGRLVWTGILAAGYRPKPKAEGDLPFTCILTFEPHGTGTKYTAKAIHGSEADAKTHADMGFHGGWGTCLDQLVALMKTK